MNKNELKITLQGEAKCGVAWEKKSINQGHRTRHDKNNAKGTAKQNEPTQTEGDEEYLNTRAGEHC